MNKDERQAGTNAQHSKTAELLPSAPLVANPMLAVRARDWLIRKWRDDCGGEYDLVRFKEHVNDKKFKFLKFYRVENKKVENIMQDPFYDRDDTTNYLCDSRMDYQFRLATKKEVKKLARIIIEADVLP